MNGDTAKDWYSPGEMNFTIKTALWLIQNLEYLRKGYWPPEASDYIGQDRYGSKKAYFETPIEYAAEIQKRLEECREDGLILEAIECWGKSPESMAKYLRRPTWSILKRRKRALGYVASGPARRWHKTEKREAETYDDYKERKGKWPKHAH